jgi:hypothetical protein
LGDFFQNLREGNWKASHYTIPQMLVVGKCGNVPMVGSIIPANEKISFRSLPMIGVMPLVLIIKLAGKEQTSVLDDNFELTVEPVFPSSEFQDLEIRNDR